MDAEHGRIETHRYTVIGDLSMMGAKQEWASLNCLIKIESERYIKNAGKTEKEKRLYIGSLPADASCKRTGFAAQNHSLLNRIVINLLKNDKTTKVGVRGKSLNAGWDNR